MLKIIEGRKCIDHKKPCGPMCTHKDKHKKAEKCPGYYDGYCLYFPFKIYDDPTGYR